MTTTQSRIRAHVANLGNTNEVAAGRAEALLIRHYGARALEPLLGACASPNPEARFRAVWALAHTADPRAYETILQLTSDPDGRVKYDAVIALGVIGDARAIPALLALASQDPDEDAISSASATALTRMGKIAVPALQAASQSDPDDRVRRVAMEILEHANEAAL